MEVKTALPCSSTFTPLGAPMGFSGDFSSAGASVSSAHFFSEAEGCRPSNISAAGLSATPRAELFLSLLLAKGRPFLQPLMIEDAQGSSKNCLSTPAGCARFFPRFGVFPTDVDGMVEMEEQAFAAIEEAKPENIVVDKCR